MKPSHGRISELLDTFVISELAVSRTVQGIAAVLDAVRGPSQAIFLSHYPQLEAMQLNLERTWGNNALEC